MNIHKCLRFPELTSIRGTQKIVLMRNPCSRGTWISGSITYPVFNAVCGYIFCRAVDRYTVAVGGSHEA